MNMSLNLGRPVGLVLMLLSGVILLAMPLVGVWTMAEEFSPISYSVEGNVVTASHLWSRQFDLGENFEAELLDTLPTGIRTNGTSIGTLRRGNFTFQGIGSAWVLFHTDETPFIVLTRENGQVLIFNFDPAFEPLLG